jgi:hypothetical protein
MKKCKVESCKNFAGKNLKTGKFYDICEFHYSKKIKEKSSETPKKSIKTEKTETQDKDMAFKYNSNLPLIIDFGQSFIINHPKKIRYMKKVLGMKIVKEQDLSITISIKDKKTVNLPFKDQIKMEKAYQELLNNINK